VVRQLPPTVVCNQQPTAITFGQRMLGNPLRWELVVEVF
jgi:hypothetical protein